jgi:glyoxylase-like metal-dependent hydrolase (beta-lactamase superfamily II)
VVVLAAVAAIRAQDVNSPLSTAARAIGADNLTTIRYSATGSGYSFGQNVNPNAPWPRFTVKTYKRDIDFGASASRLQILTERADLTGGGVLPNGEQFIGASSPWPQRLEILMTPPGFLRAALATASTVRVQRVNGKKYNIVTFAGQNGASVNGYLNDQNMLERIETRLDNPVLGDMLVEAVYTDYKDFGGIKFPTRIVQKQGGFPIWDLTVADVQANAAGDVQPPAREGGARGGTGAPGGAGRGAGGPVTPTVQTQKVAAGVFFLSGGSHHSVAVEFKDWIAVIEGPLNEERSLAVIAETKKQIPNKPIKYLVNTHHHFDHSGGIRTFVDEGATIVTHQINKPFYEKAFAAPRTLNPDRLAQSKKRATFDTLTDKKVLTDGTRTLELHLIKGSLHAEGLLMAYLPSERLLVEVDIFNPPAATTPPDPTTVNLAENVERLKLNVNSILSLHGRGMATKADLDAAAGKTAAR